MRVSLTGVMKNAIQAIQQAIDELQPLESDENCIDEIIRQMKDSQFMLGEIHRHALQVMNGEEPLAEFGRHYCLVNEKPTQGNQ